MKESDDDFIVRMHREEVERMRREGPPQPRAECPGIPYTDLPQASPDSPLFEEWECYRREVGRLLAEGKEGQFVLIKGRQIVGLYATEREALQVGYPMFPCQAFLVHQVQQREPLLRCWTVRLCRS
jgi:hypothetical protein